MDGLANVM